MKRFRSLYELYPIFTTEGKLIVIRENQIVSLVGVDGSIAEMITDEGNKYKFDAIFIPLAYELVREIKEA